MGASAKYFSFSEFEGAGPPFTAAKKYEGDSVFIPKKYERYRVVDTKRGLTYTGWIKDFTFGLNKAKEQDYVLQIQSIT